MSEDLTLLQKLQDIQKYLQRFSLLMESKYENQLSLLNKIKENSKRSYVSKMNYLSLISGKIDTVFKFIYRSNFKSRSRENSYF